MIDNPFASCRTRPGAIPFQFPEGASMEALIARLRASNNCGQIVGPHSSGKSTLLATLIPQIESRGSQVRDIALHDGQRHLPADFLRFPASKDPWVLVVDGYEQLSLYSRLKLRWHCWRRKWGLLVTTHAKVCGLPVLISLAPNRELMHDLLGQLLNGDDCKELRKQAEMSFCRHAGNLREVWFDLYDRHERKVRGSSACRVLPCAGK